MTVLRTLRERPTSKRRVLILSARSEIADKVDGLDAGANDYLAKPFHLGRAGGPRPQPDPAAVHPARCLPALRADCALTPRAGSPPVDGQTCLALTRKESSVLEYLLLHQGRPVSQEELMEHVWDGTRRCVQQLDSGAYLGAAQKAAHGTGV